MGRYLSEMDAIVGLLAPVDKTGAVYAGTGVNMANYRRCTFIVHFGVESTIDTLTLLVKANTAATAGGTAIACRYKKSSDGSATSEFVDDTAYHTLAAAGLEIADGTDNMIYAIEVLDTDVGSSGRFVNLSWGSPGTHACLVSVVAILSDARSPQLVPIDPTS